MVINKSAQTTKRTVQETNAKMFNVLLTLTARLTTAQLTDVYQTYVKIKFAAKTNIVGRRLMTLVIFTLTLMPSLSVKITNVNQSNVLIMTTVIKSVTLNLHTFAKTDPVSKLIADTTITVKQMKSVPTQIKHAIQ